MILHESKKWVKGSPRYTYFGGLPRMGLTIGVGHTIRGAQMLTGPEEAAPSSFSCLSCCAELTISTTALTDTLIVPMHYHFYKNGVLCLAKGRVALKMVVCSNCPDQYWVLRVPEVGGLRAEGIVAVSGE